MISLYCDEQYPPNISLISSSKETVLFEVKLLPILKRVKLDSLSLMTSSFNVSDISFSVNTSDES